jgi:hypothetical protein
VDMIQTLEREEIARLNRTIPAFAPGDTVIVSVNVVEGTRKRVQAFEGVVIAKRSTTCAIARASRPGSRKSWRDEVARGQPAAAERRAGFRCSAHAGLSHC